MTRISKPVLHCYKECPVNMTTDQRDGGKHWEARGAGYHLGLAVRKSLLGGTLDSDRAKELNRPRHQGGVQQNVTNTEGYRTGVIAYSSGKIV